MKEGDEKSNGRSPPPLPLGKRILFVAALSSSFPLPFPLMEKKTRDLPDLSLCHCCRLRFPSNNSRDRLRILKSQWRIVLLCKNCLPGIRSAEVCSYCFSKISGAGEEGGSLCCRDCSRRIHCGCISRHRRYVPPFQLDLHSFSCIDCCAIPKSGKSRVELQNVSSMGNKKVVAKENVPRKEIVAKQGAELVSYALDAVVAVKEKEPPIVDHAVPDEELALQLHRAMNGSPRILRGSCGRSLQHSAELKNVQGCTDSVDRDAELDTHNSSGVGVESCELQQAKCVTPDRFLKKYSRRCTSLKAVEQEKSDPSRRNSRLNGIKKEESAPLEAYLRSSSLKEVKEEESAPL